MEPEFELWDTDALAEHRYFDIEIAYAKRTPDDILIRATATNRGPEPAICIFCRRSGFAIPGAGAVTIANQFCVKARLL